MITIDHTKIPNTDQAGFPMLFSGTYAYLATIPNGGNVSNIAGYDIIFASDALGSSKLAFEREKYVSSTGEVDYWIKIPSLSHFVDTNIYLIYGSSTASTDPSNPTGVWDANYMGVWHLGGGTTLNANDSTINGLNGTLQNSPTAATGQIDGGAGINGVSYTGTYITFPVTGLPVGANTRTLETWFKLAALSGGDRGDGSMLSYGAGGSMQRVNLYYYFSGPPRLYLETGGSGNVQYNWSTADTNWHQFVATYPVGQTSSDQWSLYLDGAPLSVIDNSPATMDTALNDPQYLPAIGTIRYWGGSSDTFLGTLDEARISNIARSADWISAEYNNQSSPATFYSVGAPSP
jgi:hypothetical protein